MIAPAAFLLFLQAWQDERHLLAGTKCNQLLQWDTATGRVCAVPLPPAPPRDQPVEETLWGSCGIHSVAVNPAGDMVATGGAQPADCAVLRLPDFAPVQTLVVSAQRGLFCCRCGMCQLQVTCGTPALHLCLPSFPSCHAIRF
jgi:WD repeat-containing protein 40A